MSGSQRSEVETRATSSGLDAFSDDELALLNKALVAVEGRLKTAEEETVQRSLHKKVHEEIRKRGIMLW